MHRKPLEAGPASGQQASMDTLNQSHQHAQEGEDLSEEELDALSARPLSEREWVDANLDMLIEVHARLKRYVDFYALGVLDRCSFADFCTFCYQRSSHR